jgi:subtilisin
MNRRAVPLLVLCAVLLCSLGCRRRPKGPPRPVGGPTLLSFSKIENAWVHGKGQGVTVAIMDWQFDPNSKARARYVNPTTLIPGERMGDLKPWHGSWMVNIVHTVAPEASIMPIITRSLKAEYAEVLPRGIRVAADHGASVVTSSQGTIEDNQALRDAVAYAFGKGCLFVDVHPELISHPSGEKRLCRRGECLETIIHSGVVSVPAHTMEPNAARDVCVWPYDLDSPYEDGWGFSNAPPTVAGVIALMLSANRALPIGDVKRILVETAEMRDGFRVLNAEAAVAAAVAQREPASRTSVGRPQS